jgi:hypothetical protein
MKMSAKNSSLLFLISRSLMMSFSAGGGVGVRAQGTPGSGPVAGGWQAGPAGTPGTGGAGRGGQVGAPVATLSEFTSEASIGSVAGRKLSARHPTQTLRRRERPTPGQLQPSRLASH